AGPAHDIVEAQFEQLQQHLAGVALEALGLVHVAAELLLEDVVVVAQLLLLVETQAVVTQTTTTVTVDAVGVELTLGGVLRDVRDGSADATRQFDLGAEVTGHSNTPSPGGTRALGVQL